MAKKVKAIKKTKTRSYTITDMGGRPCLRINGNFLATEYGLETGSRVEVVQDGDLIIIKKVDQATADYLEAQKQRNLIKQEMKNISEKIALMKQANNLQALG